MRKVWEQSHAVAFAFDYKPKDFRITIIDKNSKEVGWIKYENGVVTNQHTLGNIVYQEWQAANGTFGITLTGHFKNVDHCELDIKISNNHTINAMTLDNAEIELTDKDFYKFQVGDVVYKCGRAGVVKNIDVHPEFGVFCTLKMDDDYLINEVYHEDDLTTDAKQDDEPLTDEDLGIVAVLFLGIGAFAWMAGYILTHKAKNIVEIYNSVLNVFQ